MVIVSKWLLIKNSLKVEIIDMPEVLLTETRFDECNFYLNFYLLSQM